jgi:hypothetical protein
MPAKPLWYSKINEVIAQLEALPRPFVDRATLEALLGVGRRRAQQLLAPSVSDHVGTNGLADRYTVIAHLRRLRDHQDGYYERRRRQNVATLLSQLHEERLNRPQLLVEAPIQILTQQLENLPEGVLLEPGRITLTFEQPQQALEKLLALAMAVSNDFQQFEKQVAPKPIR